MFRFNILFLISLFIVFSANAYNYKGEIVDKITLEPIPYAGVTVSDLGISTISNELGIFEFKLPSNINKFRIDIETIGYKAYSREIRNGTSFIRCKLIQSPINLDEVIVTPKDTVRNILRRAFKSIIKNYPQKPTLTKGFYREVQKENDSLYCFTESILSIYKSPYKKSSQNEGQVEVLKSRKSKARKDSSKSVRFYGGTHLSLSSDFVFKQPKFIIPKYIKRYKYEFKGEIQMGKYSVLQIDFSNKKNSITGSIYIDKKSFAYVGFDILNKQKKSNSILSSYKVLYVSKKVRFKFLEGKWNLSHIILNYQGEYQSSENKVSVQIEFITNSIKTNSVSPIPYERQFLETDIISVKSEEYSKTHWKDYKDLQNDSTFLSLSLYSIEDASKKLQKNVCENSNKRNKILRIIKRLKFKMGVGYNPIKSKGGQYYVFFQDKNGRNIIKDAKISSYSTSYHLYMDISYWFNKHWGVFYGGTTSINSTQVYDTNNIGVSYTLPISKINRNNFLEISLAYSFASYNLCLGKGTKSTDKLYINGKKFDADKINVLWGKHSMGIMPTLSLHHKIGTSTYLFVSLSSSFELYSEDKISFQEKSGFFLTRKKQKVEIENKNLRLRYNNTNDTSNTISKPYYQINLGISYQF